MIKYIRLLLEYHTYPVWLYAEDGGVIDTLLPEELRDNVELEAMFDDIQDRYDALFIDDAHEFSYIGFETPEAKKAFFYDLEKAVEKLKKELNGKYEIVDDLKYSQSEQEVYFARGRENSSIVNEDYFPVVVQYCEEPSHYAEINFGDSNLIEFSYDGEHKVTKFQVIACENYQVFDCNFAIPTYTDAIARIYMPDKSDCKSFDLMVYNNAVKIQISNAEVSDYYKHGNLLYGITADGHLVSITVCDMSEKDVEHTINELKTESATEDGTVCSKCGGEVKYYQRGSCQGYHCIKCGWGAVTTYIEPIRADNTIYTLSIGKIAEPNIEQIRIVSDLIGMNYVKTKKCLIEGTASLKGHADEIKNDAKLLKLVEVEFSIDPQFPYDIDDKPIPLSEIDLQIEDLLWFGVDNEGSIVAFTSAGTGNVPAFVCADKITNEKLYNYFSYRCENVAETLLEDTEYKIGLEEDAQMYCQKGLYYYDADGMDYEKIASPSKALKLEDLDNTIQTIMKERKLDFAASKSNLVTVPHAF